MGPTGKHSDTADNQICGYDEDWENPEECANVVLLVLAAAIEVVLLLGLVQCCVPSDVPASHGSEMPPCLETNLSLISMIPSSR